MIVVACPEQVETALQAGQLVCPDCPGVLRPHGHGRARTVRALDEHRLTVRPRRARCAECATTHILLPSVLGLRRADATEVIGTALAAKAAGAGYRTIAARLGRPASTLRRWLRRAPVSHAQWLYERGVEHAARIDREILVRPAPQPSLLGTGLNLLAGAALAYRRVLGSDLPAWTLIGWFARGHLLAPPLRSGRIGASGHPHAL